MAFQPIMLDLSKQKIVIIGGGRVAERRVYTLLESGGIITMVSPSITEGIHLLWEEGKILWKQKEFEPNDLKGAFVILAATDNHKVNQWVVDSAPPFALVNNVSNVESGNIQIPAHFNRGRLSIGISTDGASPMLSAKIRGELEGKFPEDYGEYLDFLYECRKLILQLPFKKNKQRKLLKELLDEEFLQKDRQKQVRSKLEELSRGGDDFDELKR